MKETALLYLQSPGSHR